MVSDITKIWTILDLIKWGTEYFKKKKIESPRLTIELLLCHILHVNRISLYTQHEKPLSESELSVLREFVKRRANREPLQYIVQSTEFLGIKVFVNKHVLIPRPETELLTSLCIDELRKYDEPHKILDIGTGSGCIAIALAKQFPDFEITALDVSTEALGVAEMNAAANNIRNIKFVSCDILKNIPVADKWYIIVTNPPYISSLDFESLEPEIKYHEPFISLTDEGDGLVFYRRFAEIFPEILSKNGTFFMEIGFGQFENISKLFGGYQLSLFRDFSGIPRVIKGTNW